MMDNFKSMNSADFKIYIKFIKDSQKSSFNCQKELKGLLKLCLLNEIASKIDDAILEKIKNDDVHKIIYFILKVLKNSSLDLEEVFDNQKFIQRILGKDKGKNIISFSNFVDDKIDSNLLQWTINFLNGQNLQEINDIKFRLGKYDTYMDLFERDLNKYLRNSIFEFSVISLVILDRPDYDKFETSREKCPNRVDQILFHATVIHPISCILTSVFRRSERFSQHGKGVYFTDFLDYISFYGKENHMRSSLNKIPKIGEPFTSVSCLVYYDKKGFLKVNDYKTRIQPGKNEVNFAYIGCKSETITEPDFRKFVGTEYVIWDYDQMLPFMGIKFQREEYCVIWKDDNFSEKRGLNNQLDEKYLKERIKYIKQNSKYNIYPCDTTVEALKLINRKKYNKIILLSNVGTELDGKKFVDESRRIIGNNVIVLFFDFNINHLDWIKNYKNCIFSNESKYYEEYLDSFTNESKLKEFIKKLEQYYKVRFNIDYDSFLNFPLYKEEGNYSDLSF